MRTGMKRLGRRQAMALTRLAESNKRAQPWYGERARGSEGAPQDRRQTKRNFFTATVARGTCGSRREFMVRRRGPDLGRVVIIIT